MMQPECAQLKVTGSGSGVPSGSYLTSIPAYASQSDPGVTVSPKVTCLVCVRDANVTRLTSTRARRPRTRSLARPSGVAKEYAGLPSGVSKPTCTLLKPELFPSTHITYLFIDIPFHPP